MILESFFFKEALDWKSKKKLNMKKGVHNNRIKKCLSVLSKDINTNNCIFVNVLMFKHVN